MGRLGYTPCIYDSFYPCSDGCSNTSCEFYTDDEYEDMEDGEQEED